MSLAHCIDEAKDAHRRDAMSAVGDSATVQSTKASTNDARSLLVEAAKLFDESASLKRAARDAWRGGFASGASWMSLALEQLRGRPLPRQVRSFHLFGWAKYGLASTAGMVFAGAMIWIGHPLLSIGAVFVFYAIEAQMVFFFPLLLDGSHRPIRDSLRWTRRAGGTIRVMRTVVRLAVTMLLGGFAGGGLVRSWSIGCLAVCLWYERIRLAPCGEVDGLHIRYERIEGWNLPRPYRLLFISDLHLGRAWTRQAASESVRAARATKPNLILLGGDLLDCAAGAALLTRCVRLLTRLAPVYAVAGNHDRRVGIDTVKAAVISGGGTWLEDAREALESDFALVRTADQSRTCSRTVLCVHDPVAFPAAVEAGIDLTLSGHLHGGQCVLFQHGGRLYPGAWFASWTGLRFERGRSALIVSRGAADTLPLRWNCPREVVVCEMG